MAVTKISVREFDKKIKDEIRKCCTDQGWNFDTASERGYAFQLWWAEIVHSFETTYDTEPEDSLLKSKDLKADVMMEDSAANRWLICQCKYQTGKKASVDEAEVNDFFSRHDLFLDTKWVQKHGSADAVQRLSGYKEHIASGGSVVFYFVSTGKASERVLELVETKNKEYKKKKVPVECMLLDATALKDYYVRSLSIENSVPKSIELDLPEGLFFQKETPYLTLLAVLKGNSIRDLAKRYKHSLYAWNIRGYLGNRGINQQIHETAQNRPAEFFYLNNGISAICTGFELNGNHLTATNFQIINGAQTVSSLHLASAHPEVEVLFRLTKTKNVKTEKGFNKDIIQFNNTQNVIKLSDFRSNDPIQDYLEKHVDAYKPAGVIPRLNYQRKRGIGRRKLAGKTIQLEEMAKIRYAWFYEPTLISMTPKSLWTSLEDGGVYEKAFGHEGNLIDVWSQQVLEETIFATVIYLEIVQSSKNEAKEDSDYRCLYRLRFHMLALAHAYFLSKKPKEQWPRSKWMSTLKSEKAFDELWLKLWPKISAVSAERWFDREHEKMTFWAFVRSVEDWSRMLNKVKKSAGLNL